MVSGSLQFKLAARPMGPMSVSARRGAALSQSLAEIYDSCAPGAFRRARHLLGNDEEAWDIVQGVFEKMARNPGCLRGDAKPMTYVYRATTNACINRWKWRGARTDARAVAALRIQAESGAQGQGQLLARQLLEVLWDRLDETDQKIVTLHFIDGLPQAQVAEVLGIWRRTVGRRLSKIQRLARELEGGTP